MPEISKNATSFILTSQQALNRASSLAGDSIVNNTTVAIIFACFYLEESLDEIIKSLDKTEEMKKLLQNNHPDMFDKFAWICHTYILDEYQEKNRPIKGINYRRVKCSLEKEFPNFSTLSKFQSDLLHGKLNDVVFNLEEVRDLIQSVKSIVQKIIIHIKFKLS